MPHPLEVLPFSEAAFRAAVLSDTVSAAHLPDNAGVEYLIRYLGTIGVETMVVERDYTDGDYLDDYANYYVKAFRDYPRRCTRLHFFSRRFDSDDLREVVLGQRDHTELQETYQGFVVIRPLPNAVIGRTAVATYPPDGGRRNYRAIRRYPANLYGIELAIDSLAFQQQDTVLAACATVALWSAFHKTAEQFGSKLPTPAEITTAATSSTFTTRPLPSRGLTLAQLARGVRYVGLEPELLPCGSKVPLASVLYGYLEYGVPVVLGLDVVGHGIHAVTVTGYSLQPTRCRTVETGDADEPKRIGLRIDEIYVHDDQFGPFAKIEIEDKPAANGNCAGRLTGSWQAPGGGTAELVPIWMVVPAYHKIRLTYMDLQPWILAINLVARFIAPEPDDLEWRIRLTDTNRLKADIQSWALPEPELEHRVLRQYPRFLWQASLYHQDDPLLELIMDATGMARTFPGIDAAIRNSDFRNGLESALAEPAVRRMLREEFSSLLDQAVSIP